MDYKAFGQTEEDTKITMMVSRDGRTGMTHAHKCNQKGAADKWAVEQVKKDIDTMGYADIVLKTDGEPAML